MLPPSALDGVVDHATLEQKENPLQQLVGTPRPVEEAPPLLQPPKQISPWSEKLQRKVLLSFSSFFFFPPSYLCLWAQAAASGEFVCLEDITFGLKNPCILDLKMVLVLKVAESC